MSCENKKDLIRRIVCPIYKQQKRLFLFRRGYVIHPYYIFDIYSFYTFEGFGNV